MKLFGFDFPVGREFGSIVYARPEETNNNNF